jgi:hypothetical protein
MLCRCLPTALLFAALVGCKTGSEVEVTGTITIDQQPLPNGDIRLIPINNTPGLGGSARTNAAGKFTLMNSQGGKAIAAGEYKVVISKRKRPDGSDPDPNAPPIESDARETLPGIWSDENQTTVTVTISKDKKSYDFTLTTPDNLKTSAKPK